MAGLLIVLAILISLVGSRLERKGSSLEALVFYFTGSLFGFAGIWLALSEYGRIYINGL